MLSPSLPLNALRAFEAAARHQNLTRAALELCVSQAALSHQIRSLEDRLGVRLFHRLPRGVALTDEGAALYPVMNEAFQRISLALARFTGSGEKEVLTLGVVGTFATGWLLPRLADFQAAHPDIELRLQTHNNRIETWLARAWTWPSASARATGRGRSARACCRRHSRHCAHRAWRAACACPPTSPVCRCCVPTALMNGRAGCRPQASQGWKRAGRFSTPR